MKIKDLETDSTFCLNKVLFVTVPCLIFIFYKATPQVMQKSELFQDKIICLMRRLNSFIFVLLLNQLYSQ